MIIATVMKLRAQGLLDSKVKDIETTPVYCKDGYLIIGGK